jgi:sensor domain CHASE-containing protein
MKIHFNQLGIVLISILLGLSFIVGVMFLRYEPEGYKRQELEHVQQTLDGLKGSLKNRLYANIHKVSAVKALVEMDPDLTQEDFARAMEVQFRGEHDFQNIGLARDMVIQFMYPIEGNEVAIGLDYRTIPEQFEAVNLARSLNKIVLAGPILLVQGEEGIIARIPTHVTDTKTHQEQL